MISTAKASDGRRAVTSFTWFNLNGAGATYNLQLFNEDGTLNALGKQYIKSCQAWASGAPSPPSPPTPPTPPSPPTPAPPTPTPTPSPSANCNVGDSVLCPGATYYCAGNQCCQDGTTCPSASEDFNGCSKPKT